MALASSGSSTTCIVGSARYSRRFCGTVAHAVGTAHAITSNVRALLPTLIAGSCLQRRLVARQLAYDADPAMGRIADLVRRATPRGASTFARTLALRVIDRALTTGRTIGDLAEAIRPALGAGLGSSASPREIEVVPRSEPEPLRVEPMRAEPTRVEPRPAAIPAEPTRAEPTPPDELGWTLARHVSTTTAAHASALLDADPWTDDGHDPEVLRRIRVASRRLRELVAVFEPALRPKLARRLRRRLRALGRALGPLREQDVLATSLQDRLATTRDPAQAVAIEHVLVDVERERDDARDRARRALAELDRTRLRADLEQAVAAAIAPFVGLRADPREEVWTLLQPRIEAAFAAAPLPADVADDDAVHAVRIHAKRLRYAYDLLAPAIADARPRKALRHVQRAIGNARDRGLVAMLVERHHDALREQGHTRLAAGLAPVVATLRSEADDARAEVASVLARFDRTSIVDSTRAALGVRALAVVADADDPPRAAATKR